MAGKKTKTSLQDIADELGISKNAVSLALAGKSGVGEELQRSILETATRLNYQIVQRRPATAQNFLALVNESHAGENSAYTHTFWGIEQGLRECGHHLMMAGIPPSLLSQGLLPPMVRSFKFSGVFLVGAIPSEYLLKVFSLGLPAILVDHHVGGQSLPSVEMTNEEGGWAVTRHLIDHGHRDIGVIGPAGLTGFADRYLGWSRALAASGLTPDPRVQVLGPWAFEAEPLEAARTALDLLPRLPTALFCLCDTIALGVMAVLRDRGHRVPEEVSVVGFDDIQAAHLVTPGLTTYRSPRVEMGREAARSMVQWVENPDLREPTMRRCLYGSLQPRQSVCPPRAS